tara:strand:- start:202 stop:891 length:690 start_codon:yes stop_codon:yes gene_type:complete
MEELDIQKPATENELISIQNELITKNDVKSGLLYLQVTRGKADRDFSFPKDTKTSLIMFTQKRNLLSNPSLRKGITVITIPDIRWKRRDIKSIGLLAQSMAKQFAIDSGADDAWMVEEGFVTEGSSSNTFIITSDEKLITRNLSNQILHGITRDSIIRICRNEGLTVEERPFSLDEAYSSVEAFSTASSSFILPVVNIDGHHIANGLPGPVTCKIQTLYFEMINQIAYH